MGASQSNTEEPSHDQSWAGSSNSSQHKGHNLAGSFRNHEMVERHKKKGRQAV